ncbi:MAG: M15 family metallopeptidase [Nitritalea sp.]
MWMIVRFYGFFSLRLGVFALALIGLGICFSCAPGPREGEDAAEEVVLAEGQRVEAVLRAAPRAAIEQELEAAGLLAVEDVLPGVFVDLKYASTDNFFGQNVYGELQHCYLQPEVMAKLERSYAALLERRPDLTFLVFDGVRPQSVQQVLWDALDKPDSIKPLYVADPKKGGLHNFGAAVDLTLADRESGEALDMGTPFDYFGYEAYPDREEEMLAAGKLSAEQVANRRLLREVMRAGGFSAIGSEWWHFNAYSREEAARRYALIP